MHFRVQVYPETKESKMQPPKSNTLPSNLLFIFYNLFLKTSKIVTNTVNIGIYLEPIIQLFNSKWKYDAISAKITDVRHITENIFTITLKPDSKWRNFKAGQFIQMSVEVNGALITRTFSISSEPNFFSKYGKIALTIRSQKRGTLTPWLQSSASVNDTVYISQASGEFTLKKAASKKLFIAAGSGITAIIPILKQHKCEDWVKDATLLFYVKNETEKLFSNELKELETSGLSYQYIYSDDRGRICQQHLDEFVTEIAQHEAYLCGPPQMIQDTKNLLLKNQVDDDTIFFEYFGPPPFQADDIDNTEEIIRVRYLSSQKHSHYQPNKQPTTLLDLAESQGLQPLSGCRTGICHQCICKKKQGRVFNIKTQKYSDSGREDIQLCLSVPVEHIDLEL